MNISILYIKVPHVFHVKTVNARSHFSRLGLDSALS